LENVIRFCFLRIVFPLEFSLEFFSPLFSTLIYRHLCVVKCSFIKLLITQAKTRKLYFELFPPSVASFRDFKACILYERLVSTLYMQCAIHTHKVMIRVADTSLNLNFKFIYRYVAALRRYILNNCYCSVLAIK
jgi:hypothetical protein